MVASLPAAWVPVAELDFFEIELAVFVPELTVPSVDLAVVIGVPLLVKRTIEDEVAALPVDY